VEGVAATGGLVTALVKAAEVVPNRVKIFVTYLAS
jgi:hypothetical protein